MCGIAGFVDKKGSRTEAEKNKILADMLGSIRHRGLDGEGTYMHDAVGLAHARLSILDVSEQGRQPMSSKDKNITLSFNGELYNHENVREEIANTYTFNSHSDTETLLYAYEEWKEKCLDKFKGMFAFSVYDHKEQQIFLAVDRFGIKPLYYLDTPDWFAWSSESKSLLLLPGVTPQLNRGALGEYLAFRSLAGPDTLFAGIQKLLPGQYLRYGIEEGKYTKQTYWNLLDEKYTFQTDDHVNEIKELLETSVKEHMLSDVPLGVQLSGGVDSSLIAALVKKNIPQGQELHSFSIGLAEKEWNEFPYSRMVAEQLGTTHHELLFTEEDFCRALPVATYQYDEPINHSHSVPMMLLAEHAKKQVKVLLSGEGADEVFGGYRRYASLTQRSDLTSRAVLESNAFIPLAQLNRIVSPSIKADLSSRESILASVRDKSSLYQLCWYDLHTYVTPLLLRQDKMGMKSSLENRVPFLDHELVTAGFHLSDTERISDGETKAVLKAVAEQFLPKEVIYRPKVGFGQPIALWLRNEKGLGKYLSFFTNPKYERDFLDYPEIKKVIEEHVSGRADNSALLWILINLELWMRIFIDGEKPESMWSAL